MKTKEPDLSVEIAGIRMKNPVMPASGTFDGESNSRVQGFDISKLGAVVTKAVTLKPRIGNPPPRIHESASGVINFIGLQNPGVEVFIKEKLHFFRRFDVPVIVNIAGGTIDEYEKLAAIFEKAKHDVVTGLEVNISCPNVDKGGLGFGQDPEIAFKLVSRVRSATSLPLIIKLTPNITDIVVIARRVVEAGANAISLINTLKARAKIRRGLGAGKWIEGGLSGPAIMPIALRMVSDVYKANLGVPIIGMGGISSTEDAIDFLESGADAIAVGTASFTNPHIMMVIVDGLKAYLVEQGFSSLTEWKKETRRKHEKSS